MKTYMAKPNEVETKWYIVDATDKTLGRLATEIANVLRGKHKPTYTPHIDTGDHVIVVNAGNVKLTGKKLDQKHLIRHSGYTGGLKAVNYRTLIETKPERIIMAAVKGMLPHNRLGRQQLKKLRVYRDGNHPHEAQKPEVLEINR